jgi:hypothetical protein
MHISPCGGGSRHILPSGSVRGIFIIASGGGGGGGPVGLVCCGANIALYDDGGREILPFVAMTAYLGVMDFIQLFLQCEEQILPCGDDGGWVWGGGAYIA